MKHEIDEMLELQLQGKHSAAKVLSDKLEAQGPKGIKDPHGKNTEDIWLRHCFNRGWFLLQEGDYQKGCQLLESGRFLNVYGSGVLKTDAPIFNPEIHTIKDKSIIISLEGGYGDEMIHARFATSFKKLGAKAVYLAAAPEIVSVFERIEGVDKVILRNQANTVAHDYWVPGFSAGWVAGHTFKDFPSDPYLTALPEMVDKWKDKLKSDKIKIGIRWAGNPKFEHQQFRRFPENFITNLRKYPELQLYSLQKDHNTIDLPEGIIDLQNDLTSWEETMGAIMNLDLIVTSCTSIAHLAAAMGKETWIITPALPYHTWTLDAPHSDTSPYYKCVKLFRQTIYGKWNEPWQKLYKSLEEKFSLKHIDMPVEDKEDKKLNLGCGLNKFKGYINVDKNPVFKPDEVVDLNITPWPWKDNDITHIALKDILEHLGNDKQDLIRIIKEMYRVSTHGALWEIQVPHWRSDNAFSDPTHKHVLTKAFFEMFDKQKTLNLIRNKSTESLISYENDIDVEIVETQFVYTDPFIEKIKNKEIDQEGLNYALNHMNNVATSMVLLIQVYKPGRIDNKEFEEAIENIINESV